MTVKAPRSPSPSPALTPWRDETRMTKPGDAVEREADRMADSALRGLAVSESSATPASGIIMRQTSEDLQRRAIYEEDDDFDVARAAHPAAPSSAPPGFAGQIHASGGGSPLAPQVQARMEQAFGRSLDGVRVHADSGADRLSETIGARAFTHGQDVFFGRGEYQPGTPSGDRLLAHELAHTIQRPGVVARQKKKKRAYEPSQMTDAQKVELRQLFRESAVLGVEGLKTDFEKAGKKVDTSKSTARVAALKGALDNASKIKDGDQRKARIAFLTAELKLMDEPLWAYAVTTGRIVYSAGLEGLVRIGDPAETYSARQLGLWNSRIPWMHAGAEAYITAIEELGFYELYHLDPKELETGEKFEGEGATALGQRAAADGRPAGDMPAGGAIGGGGSHEARQVLEELHAALSDLESVPGDGNMAAVADELEKMSPEERRDFYAWLHELSEAAAKAPESADSPDLLALLVSFRHLTPGEREAVKVNRRMNETEPGKKLPEHALVDLKAKLEPDKKALDNAQRVVSNLAQMQRALKDPQDKQEVQDLGLGLAVFLEEKAMITGLLAGGASRSPLVQEAVFRMEAEFKEFMDRVNTELEWAAGETLLITLAVIATEGAATPAYAATIRRLKKLHDLIKRLQRAYAAYERIKAAIDVVSRAKETYDQFRGGFEKASAAYATLEGLLERIDSEEGLEEELEARQEQLLADLEKQLEGKFGEILEMMYIPEDTPPEELTRIFLNLPRGVTALEDLWKYYNDSGRKHDTDAQEVLAIKGFQAGVFLYPMVGMTAALIGQELHKAFPEKALDQRLEHLITRMGKQGKQSRERNFNLFSFLRRDKTKYDATELKPHLERAKTLLGKKLEGDEASRRWAPAWFKKSVRKEIGAVNSDLRGTKVKGTRTTKDKDGKKITTTEQVPLPPVRVRVKKPLFFGRGKLEAVLKLNPDTTLSVDQLTNNDFAKGIEYAGTAPDRQEAIRKWLRDAGYELTRDPAGKEHVRLPKGDRETAARSYLHIAADGRIKAGIDKRAYESYIGTVVHDSRDLPEGYYAVELKGEDTVSLKHGLALKGHQQLGLDKDHRLMKGAGSAPPKELAKPGVTRPGASDLESYDYKAALDAMFVAPPSVTTPKFNLQDRDKSGWTKLVDAEPELRKRPKNLEGRLGYIVRARSLGDLLGSRRVLELREGDDKGHLVARRFGGVDDYANLLPMLRRQNQAPGRWYGMESDMAKVYTAKDAPQGHYVTFRASFIYPSNKTRRPSKFVATWQEKDATKGDAKVGSPRTVHVEND